MVLRNEYTVVLRAKRYAVRRDGLGWVEVEFVLSRRSPVSVCHTVRTGRAAWRRCLQSHLTELAFLSRTLQLCHKPSEQIHTSDLILSETCSSAECTPYIGITHHSLAKLCAIRHISTCEPLLGIIGVYGCFFVNQWERILSISLANSTQHIGMTIAAREQTDTAGTATSTPSPSPPKW